MAGMSIKFVLNEFGQQIVESYLAEELPNYRRKVGPAKKR